MSGIKDVTTNFRIPLTKMSNYIHSYFEFNEETSISVCQIEVKLKNGTRELCAQQISGKNTTNLRRHVFTKHKDVFEGYQERESLRKSRKLKTKKMSASQKKLDNFVILNPYPPQSKEYKKRVKELSLCIATCNLSANLVDVYGFQKFVASLDPMFQLPSRHKVQNEIERCFEDFRGCMLTDLSNAHKISITIDIWTKRGYTESFLGATAHYYDSKKKTLQSVAIALKSVPHPHSAINISDWFTEIVQEWKIR